MTSIAKLQNLTTPVEINWSLMNGEKAIFTFECNDEPQYKPTHEQLVALGKYKLAKYQIKKNSSEDEEEEEECHLCGGSVDDYPASMGDDKFKSFFGNPLCYDCGSKQEEEIVFSCENCSTDIVKNSREHDECWCNNADEWFCGDCKHEAMEKQEQEEEEEDECHDCNVSKSNEGGCDCQIIACAECGDESHKYNHTLGANGLLRCDDCCSKPTEEEEDNFHFITTDKNENGKFECERCQFEFSNPNQVCWAEVGDYSKQHGIPLCSDCCQDQQENWGEIDDSDDE
jgi:hypothetical protein